MSDKKYVLVDSVDTFREMVIHIKSYDLISFDTETTSLNPRKGKIVGFSVSGEIGVGYYMPTMVYNGEQLLEAKIEEDSAHALAKKVINLLKNKKLIGHNLSFDVRYVNCFYGIDLINSIYADTILLVHTVSEEGASNGAGGSFALKEIAKAIQKDIGLDVDKEANEEQIELKASIKANGGLTTKDNFEIYKADINILSKYACADTDLTLRVYHYYLNILIEEGLENFFFNEEVMPLYKEVTIPMESNGVLLDIDLMTKSQEELLEDLKKYKKIVTAGLLGNQKIRDWIIQKATKSFPISHKGSFAQEVSSVYNLNLPKSSKTGKYSITIASLALCDECPAVQFLKTGDVSTLNPDDLVKISVRLWKQSQGGEFFNIQSKDHLGQIAFNALGMSPLSTTEKGKPQFDDDFIQSIAAEYEWAKNLRIYNKLLKIKSTYIDRFLEKQEDGMYYFYYKQHATVSGRYGSDAQQLPRPKEDGEEDPIVLKYNNLIRGFFISKPGKIFIDCDYSSLEPRVFAHVSGDDNLKKIFRDNLDFYSYIAIQTEKLSGVSANPKDSNFLKKISPSKRQSAKAYSLGIAYGLKAYALSKTLDVSVKEADKLVKGYLEGFPELENWMKRTEAFVKSNGYVKVETGRIRHLSKVPYLYEKFGDGLLDWKTKENLEKSLGKELVLNMARDYKNSINASYNVQIQALAASIVNRAAIRINRDFKKSGINGLVIANIHDQLVMEVCESSAEEAKRIVQESMETTTLLNGVSLVAIPERAKNLRDGH
jgi:DNA polymerase I-like protein with 3'-5' exonuclease and polymerase domains